MKPMTRPAISPAKSAGIDVFSPGSQIAHKYIVCPSSAATSVRVTPPSKKLNALRKLPTYFLCRFSLIILAPYVEVMIMVECDISDH